MLSSEPPRQQIRVPRHEESEVLSVAVGASNTAGRRRILAGDEAADGEDQSHGGDDQAHEDQAPPPPEDTEEGDKIHRCGTRPISSGAVGGN